MNPAELILTALLASEPAAWRRPSHETLARAVGISPAAVRTIARAIEAAGVRLT